MEGDSVITSSFLLTLFLVFSKCYFRITLPMTTTGLHFNVKKILIKVVNETNVFS